MPVAMTDYLTALLVLSQGPHEGGKLCGWDPAPFPTSVSDSKCQHASIPSLGEKKKKRGKKKNKGLPPSTVRELHPLVGKPHVT